MYNKSSCCAIYRPYSSSSSSLTLDAEAGLSLLNCHESILNLKKLSRPAEGCERKAIRGVPHACSFAALALKKEPIYLLPFLALAS